MSNSINFLLDCIGQVAALLHSYDFEGISILLWYFGFIVVNMAVSVFWRGARG